MTARQPRRSRRRNAPPAALPRPGAAPEAEGAAPAASAARAARRAAGHREHHVTQDYSYVHKDLITVAIVGVVVIAFIIAMSFSV